MAGELVLTPLFQYNVDEFYDFQVDALFAIINLLNTDAKTVLNVSNGENATIAVG